MNTIGEVKSQHWHFPMFKRRISIADEISIIGEQYISIVLLVAVSGIQFLLSLALRFGRFLPISPWNVKPTKDCVFPTVNRRNNPAKNDLVLDMGEDKAQHGNAS